MEKTQMLVETALPIDWPGMTPEAAEAVNAWPLRELLPEPLTEVADKVFYRLLSVSMIHFLMLAGIALSAAGLGMLLIGFATRTTGLVITGTGVLLIFGPASVLKWHQD